MDTLKVLTLFVIYILLNVQDMKIKHCFEKLILMYLLLPMTFSAQIFYLKYSKAILVFTGKAPLLNVSYKPQKISPKSQGTVRMLLHDRIRDAYIHPQFVSDVIKPMQIEMLFDQEVSKKLQLFDYAFDK